MSTRPIETLDVLSIGETMALLVAQEPGPLAQAQHFSKRHIKSFMVKTV